MDVAIVTVGDEILAGDTRNTNAERLARRLNERGATVTRILTIPDDPALIAETVADWSDQFDAVVVGGGLGGTHDDITMDAVADAFDRDLVLEEEVREALLEQMADYRDIDPADVDPDDFDLDFSDWGETPEGGRPLGNPVGLSPGAVVENVYVLPGVPAEMRAVFGVVADEFAGTPSHVVVVETDEPESRLLDVLEGVQERFDVRVGSYPGDGVRIKIQATDEDVVEAAASWVRERV